MPHWRAAPNCPLGEAAVDTGPGPEAPAAIASVSAAYACSPLPYPNVRSKARSSARIRALRGQDPAEPLDQRLRVSPLALQEPSGGLVHRSHHHAPIERRVRTEQSLVARHLGMPHLGLHHL